MPQTSRAGNIQKGQKAISAIVYCDALRSVPLIQLALNCQKFFDDPIFRSSLEVVRLSLSAGTFVYFMENFDGVELHFFPETVHNLMLWAREFGYKSLIVRLAPEQKRSRCQENSRNLLHKLNKDIRNTILDGISLLICDSHVMIQRDTSAIREAFGGIFERTMSEL
jgi:hypothetical protein